MAIKKLISLLVGTMLILTGLIAVSCGGETEVPVPETRVNKPAPQPTPEPVEKPQLDWVVLPRPTEPQEGERIMKWDTPPQMLIDTSKKYRAIMETEKGNLTLELFAKDVPRSVNNFVFLATQGYYDGTTFHRVIPDFMAQGGDPTGTVRGDPGYRFEDEFTEHGHVVGALSMANAGPNTNGSQFFITYVPVHQLDGKHSVFGQLVEGMDVLKNITPRDPSQNPQFEGDKIMRVIIETAD